MVNEPKVGDVITPVDGSGYVGIVTYVSRDEDTIRHRCIKSHAEYERSYHEFVQRFVVKSESLQ